LIGNEQQLSLFFCQKEDIMSMVSEFKEFAIKGSAVDMAVGIVLGAAFGKIVNSLVNDVIMPPVGALLGGKDFSSLAITIKAATLSAPAVVIKYGQFVNNAVDFLIVAFSVFLFVKGINRLKR